MNRRLRHLVLAAAAACIALSPAVSSVASGAGGTRPLGGIVAIASGHTHTCALGSLGRVYCWGLNDAGEIGLDPFRKAGNWMSAKAITVRAPGGTGALTGATAIAAGRNHSCAVVTGTVWCWGSNQYGQLGNGTTGDSWFPVQVKGVGGTGALSARAVEAGQFVSCAVLTDESVACWGRNELGALGVSAGSVSYSRLPLTIPTGEQGHASGELHGITSISVRHRAVCATEDEKGVYCWGEGSNGQLGNGAGSASYLPVAVRGDVQGDTTLLRHMGSLAIGNRHGCGLDTGAPGADDGEGAPAYCWGRGVVTDPWLGTSSSFSFAVPSPVVGGAQGGTFLTGLRAITAMDQNSCAVEMTGGVLCWGRNQSGEAGDGTATQRNQPVRVVGVGGVGYLSGIVAISAMGEGACALASAGTVFCWGYNGDGELGNGTMTPFPYDIYTPVQVVR